MTVAPLPDHLTDNSEWLVQAVDPRARLARLVRMTDASYRDASFLDDRFLLHKPETRLCGLEALLAASTEVMDPPAGWIFHTAFCASTLLATCLDHERQTLVLREPAVLSRLAAFERRAGISGDAAARRRVLALTERSYGAERVVVKPSNYANALLGSVLGLAQAIWVLDVERFGPFLVESDLKGNSLFERENAKIAPGIEKLYRGTKPATMRRFGETDDKTDEVI